MGGFGEAQQGIKVKVLWEEGGVAPRERIPANPFIPKKMYIET
jgi:hypothetical protein